LTPYPFVEGTWEGWRTLHPNTLVLSAASADAPFWGVYPYGQYEETDAFFFDDAMPPLDQRRDPKERVLGIPEGTQGGMAFPFGEFPEVGEVAVAQETVDEKGVVVIWRNDLQGAAAYWAEIEGVPLTFTVQDDEVVDEENGTRWDFNGTGSGGALDGAQLTPVAEATVAYWGVWAAFRANTEIWGG
jgi:hypothetical protein